MIMMYSLMLFPDVKNLSSYIQTRGESLPNCLFQEPIFGEMTSFRLSIMWDLKEHGRGL